MAWSVSPPPTPPLLDGGLVHFQGDPVHPRVLLEHYTMGRPLGAGQSAKVVLATHNVTGIQVAIKLIDKKAVASEWLTRITREVDIMKRLDHPNIIKMYEVLDVPTHLCLVLEYASGGEMFDYLVAHGRMSDLEARKWFQQMLSAMHYCHARGFVHRDLKAENILLDGQMNIKIADFGFANEFSKGASLQTYCGSPFYASPEIYRNVPYAGPEVDMWALGCLLYIMVTSHMPFENLRSIVRGQYQTPSWVSHTCAVAIRKMLCVRADLRASAAEMLKDPWVNEGGSGLMRPYQDPTIAEHDAEVVTIMECLLGHDRSQIEKSVATMGYDHVAATYWILRANKRTSPSVHAKHYRRALEMRRAVLTPAPPMSAPLMTTDTVFTFTPPTTPVANTPAPADAFHTSPAASADPSRVSTRNRSESQSNATPAPMSPGPFAGQLPTTALTSPRSADSERERLGLRMEERAKKSHEHGKGALSLFTRRLRAGSTKSNHGDPPQPLPVPPAASGVAMEMVTRSVDNLLVRPSEPDKPRSVESLDPSRTMGDSSSHTQSDTSAVENTLPGQSPPLTAEPWGTNGSRTPGPFPRSHLHKSSASTAKRSDEESAKPKPPSQRFAFHMKTTSTKSAPQVMDELLRAVRHQQISYQQLGHFLVVCSLGECEWEMEICKIPGLNMHGIRFKRREGPTSMYKEICSRLIDTLKL